MELPLISAVLPTRGRVELAAQAVQCFLDQTYDNKELIILDDADDLSFPEPPAHPSVRYFRTDIHIRMNIPQKRNRVCELAQGWAIFHLDSDDWSYPGRMEEQVARLMETGKAVTGYHDMLFYTSGGKVYEYQSGPYYALGTSLTFLRSWWMDHRFNEKKFTGSDTAFSQEACQKQQLDSVHPEGAMVARILGKDSDRYGTKSHLNTAPKKFHAPEYAERPLSALPEAFLNLIGIPA